MEYQPIENYGVIGDQATVALISMEGSIDFMCFPRFDSPTIFAALLDREKGGCFSLAPVNLEQYKRKQLYFPDTNILLTRFLGAESVIQISDFMPLAHIGDHQSLVRRVKAVRGDATLRMICAPQFDYARVGHRLDLRDLEALFFPDKNGPALRLKSTVPLRAENGTATAEFKVRAGETAAFILEEAHSDGESPTTQIDYVSESFKQTMSYWLDWVGRSAYKGRWREMVNRSALTLKLLTSQSDGSIVAAPTFGLPEQIGGWRNWDYRFAWIRDASFTLYALMRLGYTDEAAAFMRWTEDRCREAGPDGLLQVLYRINGSRDLPEEELAHLAGYRGSRPVRIGNEAAHQLQIDIYGELMDSVYLYNKYGEPISYDFWLNLSRMIDWVCEHWRDPDQGIWEVRSGPQPFLYSRVLSWVAIDRGIRLAIKRSFPAPLDRWQQARDEIYRNIYEKFWNSKIGAFVQYEGATAVDASSLIMPMMKFIGPADPRWRSSLRVIEKTLVDDSLVHRYDEPDSGNGDKSGREGTFSLCSFWYAECLARAGDLKQARFIFEKALGYANHLGLYSEELGPSGEHLGNFPQAFAHIGLISSAWFLDQRLSRQGLNGSGGAAAPQQRTLATTEE